MISPISIVDLVISKLFLYSSTFNMQFDNFSGVKRNFSYEFWWEIFSCYFLLMCESIAVVSMGLFWVLFVKI